VHWFSLGQEKPTLCLARPDRDIKIDLLRFAANILDEALYSFDQNVSRPKDVYERVLDESAQCVRTLRESAVWQEEYHAVERGLKSTGIAAVGWGSNRVLRERTSRLALALALICEKNVILKDVHYPGLEPLAIRCLEMKKDKALSIIPASKDGTAPQASTSGLALEPGSELVPPRPSKKQLAQFAIKFVEDLGVRDAEMIQVDDDSPES
jgi:hypothetical protein